MDILTAEGHFEYLLFVAHAVAVLAFDDDICHELHFDSYRAFALALLAAPSRGVEREVCRCVAHLFGQLLVGKHATDLVERLHVRNRIGARRFAERVLVNKLHILEQMHATLQAAVVAGMFGCYAAVMLLQSRVEHFAHQRRLAAAAHTGDNRQYT